MNEAHKGNSVNIVVIHKFEFKALVQYTVMIHFVVDGIHMSRSSCALFLQKGFPEGTSEYHLQTIKTFKDTYLNDCSVILPISRNEKPGSFIPINQPQSKSLIWATILRRTGSIAEILHNSMTIKYF